MAFTELCSAYKAKGYDLYGVSTDPVADNKAFHEKFDFSFPLLSDLDKSMTKAFDCCKPAKDGSDPCAMASRARAGAGAVPRDALRAPSPCFQVTVVVGADANVVKYENPFDAREGPAALLAEL